VKPTPRTIDVLLTPHGFPERNSEERLTIVIDVLRAGTTIAHALHAGARGIIPVESVEEALRRSATLDRDSTLLCGERDSMRIDGFDLGNSPAEYVSSAVEGKTLILLTTNGTRALTAAGASKTCLASSFVTLRASAIRAAAFEHITIVCAGSSERFAFEDFLCAGMLLEEILRESAKEYVLDDGARLAAEAAQAHRAHLVSAIRATDHARDLDEIGFGADVLLACEVDRFSFVPILRDGRIVAESIAEAPRAR
jgi:2-phosphosulfolactate phosphatase